MTSPEPSATRPLRVAGLALLGLAAVALVIGLFTMFGGNGDDQADGNGDNEQPPASTTSGPPDSSPTGSPTSPTSSEPSRPPASSGAPTTGTRPPSTESVVPTPPGGDGNGEPRKSQQVRVFNNGTIEGLAARAKGDIEEAGWPVVEVGNYPHGVIPTTTVYYRPGTGEQAAAELLADEFGMRVEPRFAGIADASPGLIVILTNDYQGPGGTRDVTDKNDK